jgi:hypothetical protein
VNKVFPASNSEMQEVDVEVKFFSGIIAHILSLAYFDMSQLSHSSFE